MCGICGVIKADNILPDDLGAVKRMNQSLIHRGPNSEGYMDHDKVALAMRRLSIIDLEGGDQPLYNEAKNMALIANGEIYNFVELKRDLEEQGHAFSTKSDCETIIHAYEQYGENFLDKLRGMFAFCLYDYKNNKVILARDRMGEKPLYLYKKDKDIYFSSELKSIIENIPKEKREIDLDSLYLFFYYGYTPDPKSIIKNVDQLPAGHYLEIDLNNGSQRQVNYWHKEKDFETKGSKSQDIRKTLEKIEEMVVRSDVPVGVSLSGGIDSSLVAILAAKNSKDKLHAFGVGYLHYPINDERSRAKKLADSLGMIFHDIEIKEKEFVSDFETMVGKMDDPIADIASYGYYRVAKSAREQNVPVLLAGFGGDEFFWGYDWVRYAANINDLKAKGVMGKIVALVKLSNFYFRHLIKRPFIFIPLVLKASFSNKIISFELNPLWVYMKKYEGEMFESKFIDTIDKGLPDKIKEAKISDKNGSVLTKILSQTWLLSNCINLGDRMSMAHSIELRLPLVDYKLYEHAQNIHDQNPDDYKLGYKYWLIEAVKDIMPKEILTRKKMGFTPPVTLWTKHLIERYKDKLTKGYLVNKKIIRQDFIEEALKDMGKNMKFLYSIMLFEVWVNKYIK